MLDHLSDLHFRFIKPEESVHIKRPNSSGQVGLPAARNPTDRSSFSPGGVSKWSRCVIAAMRHNVRELPTSQQFYHPDVREVLTQIMKLAQE